MAHFTEEEQIEALKRWWSDYGKAVTAAVVVAVAGFWGWTQYQSHKVEQAQQNSATFEKMVSAMRGSGESDQQSQSEVRALAQQLSADETDSLYGNFAELYLAKLAVESGELDTARTRLQSVIDNAADSAVGDLARLRLARVLAASGDYESAHKTLQQDGVSEAFQTLYTEATGDLYLSQNKMSEAQQAYQKAMDSLEMTDFMRRQLLQTKLDSTKVAAENTAVEPENAATPAVTDEEGEA